MPNLVYTGAYPVTAGTARNATAIRDLVHDEDFPAESLSIINGLLDDENVGSWLVGREYQQRGSSIDAWQAARTTNLDWSWRIFGEYETLSNILEGDFGTDLEAEPYRPLPGACREFRMPWDGHILVMFTVYFASDNGAQPDDLPEYFSTLFLALNGSYVPSQVRSIGQCMASNAVTNFYQRARVWSGHAVVPANKGFNSLSLNVICDRRIRLTRTWASSIVVLPLKEAP